MNKLNIFLNQYNLWFTNSSVSLHADNHYPACHNQKQNQQSRQRKKKDAVCFVGR